MGKRILKAKSPGKKTREGQTNSKSKEDYRSALQLPIIVSRKRREVEQKTVVVIDFSECERMDELDQTKTEILAYDIDAMNNLEELLQTYMS